MEKRFLSSIHTPLALVYVDEPMERGDLGLQVFIV